MDRIKRVREVKIDRDISISIFYDTQKRQIEFISMRDKRNYLFLDIDEFLQISDRISEFAVILRLSDNEKDIDKLISL